MNKKPIFQYLFIESLDDKIFGVPKIKLLKKNPYAGIDEEWLLNNDSEIQIYNLPAIIDSEVVINIHTAEFKRAKNNFATINNDLIANPESRQLSISKSFLDDIIGKYKVWFYENGLQVPDEEDIIEQLEKDKQELNRELSICQDKLKKCMSEKRLLQIQTSPITTEKLKQLIDKHRFNNEKVNLTKLGEALGVDADTAKRRIIDKGLSEFAKLKK